MFTLQHLTNIEWIHNAILSTAPHTIEKLFCKWFMSSSLLHSMFFMMSEYHNITQFGAVNPLRFILLSTLCDASLVKLRYWEIIPSCICDLFGLIIAWRSASPIPLMRLLCRAKICPLRCTPCRKAFPHHSNICYHF